MCNVCECWCVFTDTLGLRIANDTEIAAVSPELRRLIEESRKKRR